MNEHVEGEIRVSHDGTQFPEPSNGDDMQGTSTVFRIDWGRFAFELTRWMADNVEEPS
jgi:hypothetical protein